MARNSLSRDQKRKAKKQKDAKKHALNDVTPYEGRKYQDEVWVPYLFEVESGIYEAIEASNLTLTNAAVKSALTDLVKRLRQGLPAAATADEPPIGYSKEAEHEHLIWSIRTHWGLALEDAGPAAAEDLIGIARTLLYSIEAHRWNTGEARGYVEFLFKFMQGQPPRIELRR